MSRLSAGNQEAQPSGKKHKNIQVCVRLRPLNVMETRVSPHPAWKWQDNSIYEVDEHGQPTSAAPYQFDQLYYPEHQTINIYDSVVEDIVKSSMEGYHGTVFAYGQTSTGKTFTMQGKETTPGIIPLAVEAVFDYIAQCTDREFLLRVSFLEIYNEQVVDLLSPKNTTGIQILNTARGKVVIRGLKEEVVVSPDQVFSLLACGEAYRHTAETTFNRESSRSHSLFRMIIESRSRGTNNMDPDGRRPVRTSVLNLVDLAGSEGGSANQNTGQRRREGHFINKSLHTLSHVIFKLSELADQEEAARREGRPPPPPPGGEAGGGGGSGRAVHIPYRDSKLTRLLQSSLSGNAQIAVICCVTPASRAVDESHNTLKFAQRAKKVRSQAAVNEGLDDKTLLRKYREEIARLQEQLARARAEKEASARAAAAAAEAEEEEEGASGLGGPGLRPGSPGLRPDHRLGHHRRQTFSGWGSPGQARHRRSSSGFNGGGAVDRLTTTAAAAGEGAGGAASDTSWEEEALSSPQPISVSYASADSSSKSPGIPRGDRPRNVSEVDEDIAGILHGIYHLERLILSGARSNPYLSQNNGVTPEPLKVQTGEELLIHKRASTFAASPGSPSFFNNPQHQVRLRPALLSPNPPPGGQNEGARRPALPTVLLPPTLRGKRQSSMVSAASSTNSRTNSRRSSLDSSIAELKINLHAQVPASHDFDIRAQLDSLKSMLRRVVAKSGTPDHKRLLSGGNFELETVSEEPNRRAFGRKQKLIFDAGSVGIVDKAYEETDKAYEDLTLPTPPLESSDEAVRTAGVGAQNGTGTPPPPPPGQAQSDEGDQVSSLTKALEAQKASAALSAADAGFLELELKKKEGLVAEMVAVLESVGAQQARLEAENRALREQAAALQRQLRSREAELLQLKGVAADEETF